MNELMTLVGMPSVSSMPSDRTTEAKVIDLWPFVAQQKEFQSQL
jgi:hypothetical protein